MLFKMLFQMNPNEMHFLYYSCNFSWVNPLLCCDVDDINLLTFFLINATELGHYKAKIVLTTYDQNVTYFPGRWGVK